MRRTLPAPVRRSRLTRCLPPRTRRRRSCTSLRKLQPVRCAPKSRQSPVFDALLTPLREQHHHDWRMCS